MDAVSLDEVEKTIWMSSGWQADQAYVDKVLAAVRRYAGNPGPAAHVVAPDPQPVTQAELPAMREIHDPPFRTYQDAEGRTWVCLGQVGTPASEDRKRCPECFERKPLSEFRTYSRDPSVRRPQCRACENRIKRKRYAERQQRKAAG